MGYSGTRGGLAAILAAERLVRSAREDAPAPPVGTDQIIARFRLAVDRIMGEAGLYHEATAADALRQAEGDTLEASHLVRAHRSTLPRLAVSEPVDPNGMAVLRRIVPAFRTPDGPQLLGRTTDYTGRLLERPDGGDAPPAMNDLDGLVGEQEKEVSEGGAEPASPAEPSPRDGAEREHAEAQRHPRRFYELLRDLDLVVKHTDRDAEAAPEGPEPFDITRRAPRPPAPRSAVLAAMARAETGSLVGLWYRSILGPDGNIHEVTLGEVRHGRLPVDVRHPHTGRPVRVGRFRVSETEAIEDLDGAEEDRSRFDVGYGLCFGHNERKAIAMANLDIANRRFGRESSLEQLLLLTTDGLDAGGFLEHLKLPHYVTFRSMIDRKLAVRSADGADAQRVAEPWGADCR